MTWNKILEKKGENKIIKMEEERKLKYINTRRETFKQNKES